MKKIFIMFLLLISIMSILAQPLPSYYTRYDQMKAIMDSLAFEYPDLIRVDSLGITDTDMIPLWGVKVSNNVHERRDVPRILIIGTIHSEEVIGIEIAIKLMKDIVINHNQPPYSHWLNELELFILPNMNPEGFQVVADGWDRTFRKNKRDNNNNGIFDFVPGQGNDIDGVDLNRNWDINWVHGDTLYSTNGYELYDYYRGEAPFSEAETKAIRDLAYQEQFTYAIVWHSSRTGNLSEKVFIPYRYKNVMSRTAPDWDINYSVGFGVASNIMKQSGTSHYEAIAAMGRNGASHVWFYHEFGTVKLLIEAGTSDIQPEYNVLIDTIQRCSNGQAWMINRALPFGESGFSRAMLTGHVRDANTLEPLRARIIVHDRESDALTPRYSNQEHGRFWRPLLAGPYTFTVRKKGYQPETRSVVVNDSGWRYREILMEPLQAITLNLDITSNGNPVSAEIIISDDCEDDDVYFTENGQISIQTYVGNRTVTIFTENGVPWQQELELTHSTTKHIDVSVADVIFEDNFNTDLSLWDVNGPWVIVNHDNRTFLTDSWGGYGFYAPGCDVDITSANPVSIPADQETYLLFEQNLYTEWEFDFVTVSVSSNLEDWDVLYEKAGKYDYWHKNLINLTDYAGHSVYLRFRLQDDETAMYDLTDPGWSIDNLKIISGITNMTSTDEALTLRPVVRLNQNYPNPFNPETKISFEIKNSNVSSAHIDVFNVKGQKVKHFNLSENDIKQGFVVWNANTLASGVYFYRLNVNNETVSTKKALLLK